MRNFFLFFGAALALSIWNGGCQGAKPVSPSRVIALNVSIPPTNELRSSLLFAGSNELMYKVEGPGMTALKQTLGPFATASNSGAIDFSVDIPTGGKRLLSLQLNDGGTHQPLAIGAAEIDFANSFPATDIVVDMGSVTRNCYFLNDVTSYANYTYGFNSDTLTGSPVTGSTYDIQVDYQACTCGAYTWYLLDASGTTPTPNSIAYMGKGNFVDYDYVPVASSFSASSTVTKTSPNFVETNDIYCIKLNTIPGGYAWMQITTPGGPFPTCPTFIFRVNKIHPYYAYDRTAADINNTCSTSW